MCTGTQCVDRLEGGLGWRREGFGGGGAGVGGTREKHKRGRGTLPRLYGGTRLSPSPLVGDRGGCGGGYKGRCGREARENNTFIFASLRICF